MNETVKSILNRVCVRSYKPEQIKDEDLKLIIDCGLHAATAMNRQPWHMDVIQKKEVIDKIVEINTTAIRESDNEALKERVADGTYHNFYHAPTVIIVSGDDANDMSEADCANMTQNMAVASEALGYGCCYIASFKFGLGTSHRDEILALLNVPEGYSPRFALAIGYMEGERPAEKPREYKVTFIK